MIEANISWVLALCQVSCRVLYMDCLILCFLLTCFPTLWLRHMREIDCLHHCCSSLLVEQNRCPHQYSVLNFTTGGCVLRFLGGGRSVLKPDCLYSHLITSELPALWSVIFPSSYLGFLCTHSKNRHNSGTYLRLWQEFNSIDEYDRSSHIRRTVKYSVSVSFIINSVVTVRKLLLACTVSQRLGSAVDRSSFVPSFRCR